MSIHFPLKGAALAVLGLVVCHAGQAARGDYYSEVTAHNPVSYWRLGEHRGNTAYDAAGTQNGRHHGNTHKDREGALWGDSDSAVYFGGNGRITVDHHDAMLLNNGTVQFWFNDLNSIHNVGLFSKDSSGYDTGGHLTVYIENGKLKTRLQSTNHSYIVQADQTVQLDTWYQVVFTFGDEGMKLYLNGELVDSNDYTGGLGTTSGGAGNYEPIVLGANSWRSGNRSATPLEGYFSGLIDEVAVFGEALDGTAVASLYEVGTTGAASAPEPGTLALLGLGGTLLIVRKRRRAVRA